MMRNLGITLVLAALVIGLHQVIVYRAAQKAVAEERARVAAKANQAIADRRATDAKFDRMDAMELCRAEGLTWIADSGRSYCVAQ